MNSLFNVRNFLDACAPSGHNARRPASEGNPRQDHFQTHLAGKKSRLIRADIAHIARPVFTEPGNGVVSKTWDSRVAAQ